MDIDSNCPSLLFGETTAHLTSKWRGTFQYFFYVENSIKREIRKNCFPKKKIHTHPPPPPPPDFVCTHPDFFFKFYFFQYLKNSYKIQTTFHQYQKLYSTPPWHGAHTCKVSRTYINVFLSYSAKTKRDRQTDGQTDRRTDGRTDGGRCNISRPGPSAPREIKIIV